MPTPEHRIIKRIEAGTTRNILCRICGPILIFLLFFGTLFPHSIFASETPGSESDSADNQSRQTPENKQGNTKFRIDVNLVTTDVRVIGQSSSELQAEDFIIYDNDVPQEVTFISYDKLPIAVALLIDRSSGPSQHFPELQIAALLSLKNLKLEDQVALFSFRAYAHHFKKHSDLTVDRLSLAEKINEIEPQRRGVNIYGALYYTARYLREKALNRRSAILLISDNYSWFPEEDIKRARSEVLKSGATLLSIQLLFHCWSHLLV